MKQGFSLIELIIVLAVLGIVSGIGVASFSNMNRQSKIEKDTHSLVDVLELAKKKASSAESSDGNGTNYCTNTNDYIVGFKVTIGTNSYTLNAECSPNSDGSGKYDSSVVTTYNLDSSNSFSESKTIEFATLFNGVKLSPNSNPVQINQSSSTRKGCITISGFGVIEYFFSTTCASTS